MRGRMATTRNVPMLRSRPPQGRVAGRLLGPRRRGRWPDGTGRLPGPCRRGGWPGRLLGPRRRGRWPDGTGRLL